MIEDPTHKEPQMSNEQLTRVCLTKIDKTQRFVQGDVRLMNAQLISLDGTLFLYTGHDFKPGKGWCRCYYEVEPMEVTVSRRPGTSSDNGT